MAISKNKKQTKKKKKNIRTAKIWSKPHVWEYLPEDFYYESEPLPRDLSFPGEDGPPDVIDEWARGGKLGLDNSGQKLVQKLYKKGGKV